MTTTNHQFMIEQLRQKNLQKSVESVAVFIACFFGLVILPSLLVQYVYAGQQLLEQPMLLEYMPVVIFALGAGYFLFTVFGNMRREMEAKKLEKELFANTWTPGDSEQDSVKALQAAMKDLETATVKPTRSRTKAATRTTVKTKTRRAKKA